MKVRLQEATMADSPELAALHTAVAEQLTQDFGKGPWSSRTTARGVLFALRHSKVLLAKQGRKIIATLHLQTKKPWAIDTAYFQDCPRALYLTSMAVMPELQRHGVGRAALMDTRRIARAWPTQAIRLDAWDAAAGAGEFYAKCGYQEVGRVTYRKAPLIYYELIL